MDTSIPFDVKSVSKITEVMSDDEIAKSSIASLTSLLATVDNVVGQLTHVVNTNLVIKFDQIMPSEFGNERAWYSLNTKALTGDDSEFAKTWRSCKSQFMDQRKADGSANPSVDFKRLCAKGQKLAADTDLAVRMANGEVIVADDGEQSSDNVGGQPERSFRVRLRQDLDALIKAYNRGIEKESEDDSFEYVTEADRVVMAEVIIQFDTLDKL